MAMEVERRILQRRETRERAARPVSMGAPGENTD
jgi:hypothetical protein